MQLLENNENYEPSQILLRKYYDLTDFTKTCLKNYLKKLFDPKKSDLSFSLHRSEDVKISKLFRIIQDKTSESPLNFSGENSFQLNLLEIFEFEEINTSSVNLYIEQLQDDSRLDSGNEKEGPDSTTKMIKLQSISLYLGMQPMIRYLTSEEAYKLLFSYK